MICNTLPSEYMFIRVYDIGGKREKKRKEKREKRKEKREEEATAIITNSILTFVRKVKKTKDAPLIP